MDIETDGALTDKWVVPNMPDPVDPSTLLQMTSSFVECEELNRLGRFSYNGHNKETEVLLWKLLTTRLRFHNIAPDGSLSKKG